MRGTNVIARSQPDLSDRSETSLRLLEGRVLRGSNIHHRSTVFFQRVDLGKSEGLRTAAVGAEFAARFVDRFGSLRTLNPEGSLRAEFLADLNGATGVPVERALLEAIRAVELAAAYAMRRLDTLDFTKLVPLPRTPRVAELVWECHSGSFSRAAARVALAGLLELTPQPSEDFAALLRDLLRRARRRQWSPTTAVLALAAKERGLPFEPLAGAHLRLGDGVMQRVVSASTPGLALESIFPTGVPAGVPTALILGDRGAGALARDLDGLLRATGSAVGLATSKLTTISGKPVDKTSLGPGAGARFLLADPRVEALVYAVSPRKVVTRGLRIDRATVTAILDPPIGNEAGDDRRGLDVCVAASSGAVIADAGHPLVLRLIGELEPQRLVLLSPGQLAPVVIRHLASGGCAVVRGTIGDTGFVELRRSSDTVVSIRIASLRSRKLEISERRIRRAMFTLALAFGLGLSGPEILAAIEKRRYFRR